MTIEEADNSHTWHPDVQFYSLKKEGKQKAYFYLVKLATAVLHCCSAQPPPGFSSLSSFTACKSCELVTCFLFSTLTCIPCTLQDPYSRPAGVPITT